MLPRTKLIKTLEKELKGTKDWLEETLSCMKRKQPNGLSYHHGIAIKPFEIETLNGEIEVIESNIILAKKLPKNAGESDCKSIFSY